MRRRVRRLGLLGTTALCAGLGAFAGAVIAETALVRPRFVYGGDLFGGDLLIHATRRELVAAALAGGAVLAVLPLLLGARRGPRVLGVLLLRGWAGRADARLTGTSLVVVSLQGALLAPYCLTGPDRRAALLELVAGTALAEPPLAALLASIAASALFALGLQLDIARHPRRGRRLVTLALATPALAVVAGLALWSA